MSIKSAFHHELLWIPNLRGRTEFESGDIRQPSTTAHSADSAINILNMSLKSVDVISMKVSDWDRVRVQGLAFMPNRQLLITKIYGLNQVWHLDSNFSILEISNIRGCDIAVLSEKVAVVTSGHDLNFIETQPKLKFDDKSKDNKCKEDKSKDDKSKNDKSKDDKSKDDKSKSKDNKSKDDKSKSKDNKSKDDKSKDNKSKDNKSMDDKSMKSVKICEWTHRVRSVAVGGAFIYVSYYKSDDDERNREAHIKVLNKDGEEIRNIDAIQNGQILFEWSSHLVASKTRVYVSGEALTCFKPDGTLVYQYKDEQLGKISGLYVDSNDNVLACAYGSRYKASDKFHVITPDGKRHHSEAMENSVNIPSYNCSDCIAIRPSDRTLVIGSFENLYVFKITL